MAGMVGLKAQWIVRAGVIPGQPLAEFTRVWDYTSEDNDADDKANPDGRNPAYHSRLAKMRAEALDYYLQVSLPRLNNWAAIEFLWM